MNWLAHVLLSKHSIDYQLGNLLADPLKGKGWPGASDAMLEGLRMHQRIDAFTDSHALVKLSKSRLEGKRLLRGVIIDILYDHLLSTHWKLFASVSLIDFLDEFHHQAQLRVDELPQDAGDFVQRLIHYQILPSYGSLEGIRLAFERIDYRLSSRLAAKETATSYFPLVQQHLPAIEQDFLQFFPELVVLFKAQSRALPSEHWLK